MAEKRLEKSKRPTQCRQGAKERKKEGLLCFATFVYFAPWREWFDLSTQTSPQEIPWAGRSPRASL